MWSIEPLAGMTCLRCGTLMGELAAIRERCFVCRAAEGLTQHDK